MSNGICFQSVEEKTWDCDEERMNKPEWCDSKSDLFIYWLKVLGLLSHIRDITMDTSSHVALEAGWLNLTTKLLNFRKPVE